MHYRGKFYSERDKKTRYAASTVLKLVLEKILPSRPRSVIDVGCGTGVWLSEIENMGIEETTGIEGNWLPADEFVADAKLNLVDFNLGLSSMKLGSFDMCISLEVAEHLPDTYAEEFILNLTRFSDVILFSAAIPGQGGRHHVNEQPLSYWVKHFSKLGYSCLDIVRSEIWNDQNIPFWYRQNTVIFTKNKKLLEKYPYSKDICLYDVIHPELFYDYRYPRMYIAALNLLQIHKSIFRTFKKKFFS